ncbi:hypothetical protein PsYK624_171950 [Phanerochaete sordida]|uniref:Uncharacterized protein n=1 Tax=Phanerochaete sordida TaxID=48140 RepID=A0A9P3GTL0_9APHY|nr:hypothetical protein PsYK624_171950 [Phanerochaete sordida]
MPRFTKSNFYARDASKPYDLAKRLSVSAETNEKIYNEVKGKLDERARYKQREKYLLKRAQRPVVTTPLPREEQDRINEEFQERLWALEEASRLMQELALQKRLADRISEPGPSLLSRIGPAPILSNKEIEEQYGDPSSTLGKVPEGLRMQKEWRLKRTAELFKLFKAVETRLRPLGENLFLIGQHNQALEGRISNMIKEFEECYDFFEGNKGQVLLEGKQFRWVKADLNRIKHVSFVHFKERIMEIAVALDAFPWRFKECC